MEEFMNGFWLQYDVMVSVEGTRQETESRKVVECATTIHFFGVMLRNIQILVRELFLIQKQFLASKSLEIKFIDRYFKTNNEKFNKISPKP